MSHLIGYYPEIFGMNIAEEPGVDPDQQVPNFLRRDMRWYAGGEYFRQVDHILAAHNLTMTPWAAVYAETPTALTDGAVESIREEIKAITYEQTISRYMTTPIVFSKPGCGQCLATEREFKRSGLEYITIDVTQNRQAYEYVTETLGFQSVPVVDTRAGEVWNGYKPEKIADLAPTNNKASVIAAPNGRDSAVTVIAQTQHIDISNQEPEHNRQL